MECFDTSNIHWREAVGAMTVFVGGFPEKSEYRRFKIKTVERIADYSMMAEMIWRRFRSLIEYESTHEGRRSDRPYLVVIEGGKGQ
jgi:excinuclease ABC subunit C